MAGSWRAFLESLPLTPPADPGGPVVVVSAHPDDEVLAIGGWLSSQRNRDITFVTATDGEASHPDSPTIKPDELRARRPLELVEALTRLGFDSPQIHRLGLPDGGLADDPDGLRTALAPLLPGASLVLAPFARDGHPDHDAVGAAALELCAGRCPVWQFPIWTWAWTAPTSQEWARSIRRLPCTSPDRHNKRRAIKAFTTQVRALSHDPADQAVVDHALLAHARFAPEAVVT